MTDRYETVDFNKEPHLLRKLVQEQGVPFVTLTLTLLSIVMSVIIGVTLTPFFIGPISSGVVIICIIVPALIAPPIIYLSVRLVHELDIAERRLQQISTTDELTGVNNRRQFINTARVALARAIRYHEDIALVVMDLDFFKLVNDAWGHQDGDLVLIEVARRTATCLRSSDTFARYGGEEFVILLPGTNSEGARLLGERIRSTIEECSIAISQDSVSVTVSIGLTALNPDDTSIDELIKRADVALYKAKAHGRNCVVVE